MNLSSQAPKKKNGPTNPNLFSADKYEDTKGNDGAKTIDESANAASDPEDVGDNSGRGQAGLTQTDTSETNDGKNAS